jgi:PAS domain S-box-containing protein
VTRHSLIHERLALSEESVFRELVELLAEAVTIRDPSGELVYANPAALAFLGFETLEQLRSRSTVSIMEDYVVEDEHGRPLEHADVPSVRMISGEPAEPVLMRSVHRGTGDLRWTLLKTTALLDQRGELLGATTVIEDVTAVKTAEIRTRVLADSGRLLASSLAYQQTLLNVAKIAVPLLADFCSVDLLNDRGQLERVAAAHHDPERRTLAEQLGSLRPASLDPEHPARRALATGAGALYENVSEAELAAAVRDEHHLRLMRQLAPRSLLIVPMRVPARAIGLMTLATDNSRRRLRRDDLELAEQLGRRAAVAVENSRLHAKLAVVAETLQQALLPAELPAVPGWELAALYKPTETELRIDVGGDFYELFEHDGRWFVILGDVAGKGVTAASVTALMRHGARVASGTEPSPAAILARLDEALAQQPGDVMATAICMCLHDDHVVMSSAGHPAAVIVAENGRLREAPGADPLLGAFQDSRRHEEEVPIGPREMLVLYTDGVIDAAGAQERFGVERLHRLLSAMCRSSPQTTLHHLDAELAAFSTQTGSDDVAVLALRPRVAG